MENIVDLNGKLPYDEGCTCLLAFLLTACAVGNGLKGSVFMKR